jgi:hypothetical protein
MRVISWPSPDSTHISGLKGRANALGLASCITTFRLHLSGGLWIQWDPLAPGRPGTRRRARAVVDTRRSLPPSRHRQRTGDRGHLPRPGVSVPHHQPPPPLVPHVGQRGDVLLDLGLQCGGRTPARSRPDPRRAQPAATRQRLGSNIDVPSHRRCAADTSWLITSEGTPRLLQAPHPQLRVIPRTIGLPRSPRQRDLRTA